MYKIGDIILYGTVGVCRVVEIIRQNLTGEEKEYYVIEPLFEKKTTIYFPVESKKASVRPIMTSQEAEAFIDRLPSIKLKKYTNDKERTQIYKQIIQSGDSTEWASMLKEILDFRRKLANNKKILSDREQTGMKSAEKLLYGELAAALKILPEQVISYINGRVQWVY